VSGRLPLPQDWLRRVAEKERAIISVRTKTALAAAKARGMVLGGPKLNKARSIGKDVIQSVADRNAANAAPIIRGITAAGAKSLGDIADALNARGISTPRGGRWHASSVRNVLARQ
jgi:DNA invertase Pin-like site-specific DNA recombinase